MIAPGRDRAFVLIHSPLVGPTTWCPAAAELERRGQDVFVPSLLGIAHAPAPQWRHVPEAVRAATERIAKPIVLVGHSGTGLLLPTIAESLAGEVAGLLFVDSFLPPVAGTVPLAPPRVMDDLRELATGDVLPPWSSWFGDETMRQLVPDPHLRAEAEREMPRLPLSYFEASVPVPDRWAEGPCGYVLLTPEPYGASAVDARGRGWPVAEIPGVQHLAIATEPIAVVDALLELERALSGPA